MTEQSRSSAAAEAFRQLRLKFVRGLPDRKRELEAARDPEEAAQALHKLAGAAGVFRYAPLADAARAAVRQIHDDPDSASEAVRAVESAIFEVLAAPDPER